MKTIKSILDNASEAIQDNLTERFGEKYLGLQIDPPLDQALKDISELIDGAIMSAISVNQKGQFEDDGGNICWYLDDLEKALRNNLKELLK
jgi:hypothetical protein